MSTPPNRSTLSNYAASNSNQDKAQAGAVAVAGAITSSLARGAASWINEASKTIQAHLPAARSATQYYTYDAKRTSEKAYRSAKKTLRNVAAGGVKVSNWMGLDLSLPEDYLDQDDDDHNLIAPALKASNGNSTNGLLANGSFGNNRNNNSLNGKNSPVTQDTAIELGEGNLVAGEVECHYTPQPTGFAAHVEVTRVQIQMSPPLVVVTNNNPDNVTNKISNLVASSSCADNMNAGSQTAAVLTLCLLGPGGSPGFAIFRVDCNDVFEEVVELHLTELDSLGPVKSVCVAEVLSYPSAGSSNSNNNNNNNFASTSTSASNDNNNSVNNINVLNPLPVATKLAIILTERCLMQYSISQRKVLKFQELSFEASDLKLCSYYALVVHSGFGQISVLTLNSGSSSSSSSSASKKNNNNILGSQHHHGNRQVVPDVTFSLDEIDMIVPEGDEIALSDRWLAYVGSGSEAARISTRLLSHAEKTTAENISKTVHAGLKAVGGFLGSVANKVTGAGSYLAGAGASSASGSDGLTTREQQQEYLLRLQQENSSSASGSGGASGRDDFIFNPSAISTLADRSDKPVGTVVIRDLATRTDIAAFVAHENPIQRMAFDSTGTILATCAVDGKNIHVFRICPKGTATATATVSSAAAFQRLPRLPSVGSVGNSMFALGNNNSNSKNANNNNNNKASNGDGSGDSNKDFNEDSTSTPNSGSPTGSMPPRHGGGGGGGALDLTPPGSMMSNNANLPNTTIVFSHRIHRGLSSGTVESLTFSQPWTWLACTTSIGTAHFFKLEMDRLTNVEENIVACENGMLAAANVSGASFRIRSAPSTVLPSPIVTFFPGEASTGAGEQTTACLVTKSSTVATAVISSVNDKGVLLYERAAAHFAGPKNISSNYLQNSASYQPRSLMNHRKSSGSANTSSTTEGKNDNNNNGLNKSPVLSPTTANINGRLSSLPQSQNNNNNLDRGNMNNNNSGRFMTAEACWMELLHRRTQPQFAPLYDGTTVEFLPEDEENNNNDDDETQVYV